MNLLQTNRKILSWIFALTCILSTVTLHAQNTICVERTDVTNPGNFTSNVVSACFQADYPHVTLHVTSFVSGDTIRVGLDSTMSIAGVTFPAGFDTATNLATNIFRIWNNGTTYSGDSISFTISLSGCGQWFNNSGFISNHFTVSIHNSSGIIFPTSSGCVNSIGVYSTGTGIGIETLTIRRPEVRFIPFINYNFNPGLTTISCENDSLYLRHDIASRYYMIRAVNGATDYFTFNIHAEHDATILSLHAVDPSTADTISGNLIGGIGTIGPAGNATIVFDSTLLHSLFASGAWIHNGFLVDTGNISTDSIDFILLKETFRIDSVADYSGGGCDFNGIFPSLNNSWYSLQIDCDENLATPVCWETLTPDSLNVECRKYQTGLGIHTLRINHELNICGTNKADLTIPYFNTSGVVEPDGAGTVEIASLSIPFNFLYFSFDSVYIGNTRINNDSLILDTLNHLIKIQGNSLPDPATPNSLNYQLSASYPWGATPASPYKFLAEDDSFNIVIYGLHFDCSPDDGLLQTVSAPLAQLFSFDGGTPGYVSYFRICQMDTNETVPTYPPAFIHSFNITNDFDGEVLDSSDATDISSTIHPNLYFTYGAADTSINPLSLTGQINGGNSIFDCDSVNYYATIQLPADIIFGGGGAVTVINTSNGDYFTIDSDSLNIINGIPVDTLIGNFDTIPGLDTSIIYASHTYILHYGDSLGFNVSDVTISFKTALACTGYFGNFGTDTISTKFFAACNSCSACPRLLGNGNVVLFKHCPGLCDAFVSIDSVAFDRSTFGWTSTVAYSANPKNPNITLVMADSMGLSLDRVYECDHVSAYGHGQLNPGGLDSIPVHFANDFGNFSFEVAYAPPAGDSVIDNLFHFNSGAFHFHCLNCDSSSVFFNDFTVTSIVDTVYFDSIPNVSDGLILHATISDTATLNAAGVVPFYDSLANTHYTFDIVYTGDYSVIDNAGLLPDSYMMDQIRCQFTLTGATSAFTLNHCCDPYGDRIKLYKLRSRIEYDNIISNLGQTYNANRDLSVQVSAESDCLLRYLYLADIAGPGGDNFPSEFRPWFGWNDTLKINFGSPYGYASPYELDTAWFLVDTGASAFQKIPISSSLVTQTVGSNLMKFAVSSLRPVRDKSLYTQQGIQIRFRRTCTYVPHDSAYFIIDTSLFEKAYGCAYPVIGDSTQPIAYPFVIKIPDTLGTSVYYNDLNNDNIEMYLYGNPGTDTINFTMTSTSQLLPIIIHHIGSGSEIENSYLYFTTDNPGANISIAISTAPFTYNPDSLYKFPDLFQDTSTFHLLIALDSCITDSFHVVAHFGYTCSDTNFTDLQTVIDSTGNPTPDLAHWNICVPEQLYTIVIHTEAPDYVIVAELAVETIDTCVSLIYLIDATNNSPNVEGDSIALYVVPPVGFVYDTTLSYVAIDSNGFPIDTLLVGFLTGYQYIDTLNALASYWNIDSIGITTPFLQYTHFNFHLVFHPEPCPFDSASMNPLTLGSVLLGYTPCLAQFFSQPKFPNIGTLAGAGYCCIPYDSITTSLHYHFADCSDSCSAILIATVTGGDSLYYYNWNTGSTSDTLFNLCPGTYSLVVHDGNGVVAYDTIQISAPDTFTVSISGDTTTCSGTTAILTALTTTLTPTSFIWSNADSIEYIETSSSGVFSVIVKNIDGCFGYDTATVHDCCNPSTIDTLLHNNITKKITSGTYTGNNCLPFYSIGTPSIYFVRNNNPVTFHGIDLKCEKDVMIVVDSGGILTIENDSLAYSNLHGCDSLWKGIYVLPGGTLIADGTNYPIAKIRISDCDYAITLINDSTVTGLPANLICKRVRFRNNERGINFTPFTNGTHPANISGNDFESPGPWLPASVLGSTSDVNYNQRFGIYAFGVRVKVFPASDTAAGGIVIGAEKPNFFTKLNRGIFSKNSCVTSLVSGFEKNNFAAIDFTGGSDQPIFLQVRGGKIDSTKYGIYYHGNSHPDTTLLMFGMMLEGLIVGGVEFNDDSIHIECVKNKRYQMTISGNICYDFRKFAFHVTQGAGTSISNYAYITWNEIYSSSPLVNGDSTYSIALVGTTTSNLWSYIEYNRIKGAMTSIAGLRLSKPMIGYNKISVGNPSVFPSAGQNSDGIFLTQCPGAQVHHNDILSDWDATVNHRDFGTYFISEQGSILANNSITNSKISAYYRGNSTGSNLYCNSFFGYDIGMNGSQPNGAGVWLWNVHVNQIGVANPAGYPPNLNARVISTTPWDSLVTMQPSDNHWDDSINDSARIYMNSSTNGANLYWFYRAGVTDEDPHTIQNAGVALNAVVPPNVDSTSLCDVVAPYMIAPTEVLREAKFGSAKNNTVTAENSAQTALLNYYEDRDAYRGLNPDSGWLNIGVNSDIDYENYYDTLDNSNIGKFEKFYDAVDKLKLSDAYSLNASITPQNIVEQIEKTVNEIYLRFIENDSLTEEDHSALLTIAYMDSYLFGNGVITARAILGLFIHDLDNANTEYRFEETEIPEKDIRQQLSWNIQPNPTTNSANIEMTCDEASEFSVTVVDMLGKTQIIISGKGNKTTFDLSELPAGVYQVNLKVNSNSVGVKKLVLIK